MIPATLPPNDAMALLRVFNSLLSATADFNYVFDRAGRFSYINRALLSLLGLTKEQAVGRNFHDLKYPAELATKLQAQIEQVYVTGKQIKDETTYTNFEGKTGYYEYIFVPIVDETGKVEAVAGSTRDISKHRQDQADLKASESALRESERRLADLNHRLALDVALIEDLNRNLERRVTERTLELEKASQLIQSALEEKVVLIKEVHHRVKNNLQIITSLLRLQSNDMTDPVALNILKQSQDRIHSMALVHELLYRSKDIRQINFKEYCGVLVRNLFASQKLGTQPVTAKVDVDEAYMDIDTAIPCGLIITELVVNALKYAFPENRAGSITVSLRVSEEAFVLSVQDTGVGLPANLDWKSLNSLGFQIVNALYTQLRGKMSQTETSGGGTSFTLTFPRKKAH